MDILPTRFVALNQSLVIYRALKKIKLILLTIAIYIPFYLLRVKLLATVATFLPLFKQPQPAFDRDHNAVFLIDFPFSPPLNLVPFLIPRAFTAFGKTILRARRPALISSSLSPVRLIQSLA
jgi:hypothetical protein